MSWAMLQQRFCPRAESICLLNPSWPMQASQDLSPLLQAPPAELPHLKGGLAGPLHQLQIPSCGVGFCQAPSPPSKSLPRQKLLGLQAHR